MEHQKIFKNTFFQIASRVITSLTTFLITLIIARNFGVVGYGDFIKIITYVGLFYLAVDFGLNAVFLQKEYQDNSYFRKLFYLRLLMAFFLFILINGISFFLPFNQELGLGFSPIVRMGIFIFSFSLITQAITTSCTALFQRHLRFDWLLFSSAIGSIATLLLIFLFSFSARPIYFTVLALVAGGIITSLAAIFFSKEKITPIAIETKFIKSFLLESLPLGLMLIFNLIYFRIDIFLLSFFKPTADVGIYGISQRLFDFLIALPLFLSNALYPILLRNRKNHRNTIGVIKTYLIVAIGTALLLVILLWFLSPFISLIKSEFSPAIVPFRILLFSLPFFFATSILQWLLISQKQQKFLMYVYLLVGVLNIFLNLLFIPSGSYIASAIITDISEGIVLVCLVSRLYFMKNFHEGK